MRGNRSRSHGNHPRRTQEVDRGGGAFEAIEVGDMGITRDGHRGSIAGVGHARL